MNQYKKKDYFALQATQKGYLARSAWKLQELDQRFRLFASGQRVLDLGAAPGSWTQYTLSKIGGGKIVAVDVQSLRITHDQIIFIHGNVDHEDTEKVITKHAPYDVVISDLATHTTGNRIVDTSRSAQLFSLSLHIALRYLHAGGSFVTKIFQGSSTQESLKEMRPSFHRTHSVKPAASRSRSFETYLIGINRRAP